MDNLAVAVGVTGCVVFFAVCVAGVFLLFTPRLYRAAIWILSIAALACLFVVAGPGRRIAIARYEHGGGTYTNEMAQLFFSYTSFSFLFYAIVAACVVVLALVALKLSTSRKQA